MKQINKMSLLIMLLALTALLFTGCQSSAEEAASLSELQEDSNWADLMPEEPPEEVTPTPEPEAPSPSPEPEKAMGTDVTDDYLSTFVGVWQSEEAAAVWEFRADGVLVLTDNTLETVQEWNWSVRDMDGSRLCLTKTAEEDRVYSFTLGGADTITLYNPETGNAQELLTRVKEEPKQEEPQTEETEQPQETQQPAPEPVATQEPAPTATPATQQEPTPNPDAEPEGDGQGDGAGASPDEETAATAVEISELIVQELRSNANYEAVESVLDTIAGGYSLNPDDPDSFWKTVSSYLCKMMEPEDDAHLYVTAGQVANAAVEIYGSSFDGIESIPSCPEGSTVVSILEDNESDYCILWGQSGGYAAEYVSYENNVIEVKVDGVTYLVTISDSGSVESVERAA